MLSPDRAIFNFVAMYPIIMSSDEIVRAIAALDGRESCQKQASIGSSFFCYQATDY